MAKASSSCKTVASTILVRPAPGSRSRALLHFGTVTVPAAIGRSGRSSRKREGDGATPLAAMRLIHGYIRGDRLASPATRLPLRRIARGMLWCDEPRNANYNRLVRAPFRPSHEDMMRPDGLYDICVVMDWNISSRRRNCGSAIFFHVARPGFAPTEGCVAVSLKDMRRLVRYMRKGTVIKVL